MGIRQFKQGDQEAVLKLHKLALLETGAYLDEGLLDSDIKNIEGVYIKPGGGFLIGLFAGNVIAMGALKIIDNYRAELKRMRTHPDYQRQGFGQKILNALEEKAISLGIETISLDTTTIQISAQKFYEKNGYKKIGGGSFKYLNLILYQKVLIEK